MIKITAIYLLPLIMRTFIQVRTDDGRIIIALKTWIHPYKAGWYTHGVELKTEKPQTGRTMQIILINVKHEEFYMKSYEIISEKPW